jgi:hypothetical protein
MKIDLQYKNLHINKELNILHIAICCILLFYSLDCIYFVFRFSLGYGFPASEYGNPDDVFADLFKVAFSIKGISNDFLKSEAFSQLDEIYKIFAGYGYKTMAEWTPDSGYQSTDWMPPVYLFAPAVAVFLLKTGASTKIVLLIYILVLYLLILFTQYYCCRLAEIKFPIILSFLLAGFAMPTIHAIFRGNFNAAYACIGITAFCITTSLENKFRFFPSFLLAISIGIRPTTIIFLMLPILLYGINRKTVRNIVYTSIITIIVTLLCWIFIKFYAHYDWNIKNFIAALKLHKHIFISTGLENFRNLSLRGLIFDIFQNSDPRTRSYIFYSSCLITAAIIFIITNIRKYNADIYVFLLCTFYVLYNESSFIYYNLVFLAPLYLCYIKEEQGNINNNFDSKFIVFISSILLSPNSFIFNSPVIFDRYILMLGIFIFFIRSIFHSTIHKEYNQYQQ